MSNVPRKTADTATVRFTHQSAYNQIVGTSLVCLSQYFIVHWLPLISANGLKILLQLRSMGYYSPKTDTLRNEIDIDQGALAKMLNISVKTIQRTFVDDVILTKYVQRIFDVKRDVHGRIIKEHYIYVVIMDDILTVEDKIRYENLLEGPDKGAGSPQYDTIQPKRQNVASGSSPKRHLETDAGQDLTPPGQKKTQKRQNVAPYNKVIHTPTTKDNTLNTPFGDSDFVASPFEDQDHTDEAPESDSPLQDSKSRLLRITDKIWDNIGRDDLASLIFPEEFRAWDSIARQRVIAVSVEPVRGCAIAGRAWTSVRPMMRKILSEPDGWPQVLAKSAGMAAEPVSELAKSEESACRNQPSALRNEGDAVIVPAPNEVEAQ